MNGMSLIFIQLTLSNLNGFSKCCSSTAFSHRSSDSVAFGISCGAGSRRTSRSLASGLAEEGTVMGRVKCFMSGENSQFITYHGDMNI